MTPEERAEFIRQTEHFSKLMREAKKTMPSAEEIAQRTDYILSKADDRWQHATGVECFVVQSETERYDELPESVKEFIPRAWYCGYVRLNRKLFRERDVNGLLTYIPVHGGISYRGVDSEGCTVFGFDCNHSDDTDDGLSKWTREAAMRETDKLALGLIVATRFEDAYLRRGSSTPKSRKWARRRDHQRRRARAEIVVRYHQSLSARGIRFHLTDQFGAMINVIFGQI